MKKIIMLHCIIIVSILLLTGCPGTESDPDPDPSPVPSPEEQPLSEQEASVMIGEVITSVGMETSSAMIEAMTSKGLTKAEYEILYSNDAETVIITGTISCDTDDTDGDLDQYPIDYTMSVILNDYIPPTSQHITLMNGTTTWIMNQESADTFYYSYLGNVTVIYDGEEYECTMSIEMTMSGSTINYTGTYTVNDYSYTYTYNS